MSTPGEALSPVKRAILEIRELKARIEQLEHERSEPLAVIGLGCRFPGCADPDDYWRLLRDGIDAIGPVPRERWDVDAIFNADPDAPGTVYTREGGYVADVDRFDASFFGISPREAIAMDPQQRLLLEVAWEALEHGGQPADRLLGSRSGVFIGICSNEYGSVQLSHGRASELDAYYGTGNALSVAAGRLSYFFGWKGPSLAVDTACSSSLAAVHLACQSLRQHECRLALAGGVNLLLRPESTINFCRAHMLAADGRCKTFDAAADGYSRGEGAGVVVLKRLGHAIEDGDRVLAVLLGTAVNQDGRSGGLTVPNGPSQEAVIRDALQRARVQPGEVSYIEAHGTGTPLGDPIEVHSLCAVFGAGRPATSPLTIGSVKTNLGHLEAAAGIAGLIKLVLSLEHGQIPKQLHFRELNPQISVDGSAIEVAAESRPWPASDRRRIAGVSAFGFSGTNAHVVVAEAPSAATPVGPARRGTELVLLSARTPTVLPLMARRLADKLAGDATIALPDVAFTLAAGRTHLAARLTIRAEDRGDLIRQLLELAEGGTRGDLRASELIGLDPQRPVLVCGAAADGDADRIAELRGRVPAFAAAVDRLLPALGPILDEAVAADPLAPESWSRHRRGTALASFVFQYALAETFAGWGVDCSAFSGRGAGACVAAALSGALTAVEAARAAASDGQADLTFARPHTALRDARSGADVGTEPVALHAWLTHARFDTDESTIAEAFAPPTMSVGGASRGDAWHAVLQTVELAYRSGVAIDWAAFYQAERHRRVALPTYPFQRQRYWSAAAESLAASHDAPRDRTGAAAAGAPIERVGSRIAAALPIERDDLIVDVVRGHLRTVLRLDPETTLDRRHRLIDLGLDSLMVVELRNRLGAAFELPGVIPATLVFDYPTVEAIASFLADTFFCTDDPPSASVTPAADAVERINQMSDEQAEALLLEKLASL